MLRDDRSGCGGGAASGPSAGRPAEKGDADQKRRRGGDTRRDESAAAGDGTVTAKEPCTPRVGSLAGLCGLAYGVSPAAHLAAEPPGARGALSLSLSLCPFLPVSLPRRRRRRRRSRLGAPGLPPDRASPSATAPPPFRSPRAVPPPRRSRARARGYKLLLLAAEHSIHTTAAPLLLGFQRRFSPRKKKRLNQYVHTRDGFGRGSLSACSSRVVSAGGAPPDCSARARSGGKTSGKVCEGLGEEAVNVAACSVALVWSVVGGARERQATTAARSALQWRRRALLRPGRARPASPHAAVEAAGGGGGDGGGGGRAGAGGAHHRRGFGSAHDLATPRSYNRYCGRPKGEKECKGGEERVRPVQSPLRRRQPPHHARFPSSFPHHAAASTAAAAASSSVSFNNLSPSLVRQFYLQPFGDSTRVRGSRGAICTRSGRLEAPRSNSCAVVTTVWGVTTSTQSGPHSNFRWQRGRAGGAAWAGRSSERLPAGTARQAAAPRRRQPPASGAATGRPSRRRVSQSERAA
ncbi:Protein of unknown function [Gryllus bimaculatus]|nr:Protein of unknown function [Gryllus bimaculatus]